MIYRLSINPREFALLCIVAWVCTILVGMSLWNRSFAQLREWRALRGEADSLRQTIALRPEIEAEREKLEASFDATHNLTTGRFVEGVDSLANRVGLARNFRSPQTEERERFQVHTLRITFPQSDIGSLIQFQTLLEIELPSVGIEEVRITASRSDPQLLDAVFRLNTVEIRTAPSP